MALVEAQNDTDDLPKYSLSHFVSTATKTCVIVVIIVTMALLLFSNLHQAEYINAYIKVNKPSHKSITDNQHIIYNNISASTSTMIQNYLSKDSRINIGDEYKIEIFAITIPSSIKDFWQSEAYELAIIIAAASLIWPYIKLIILLIVWLVPLTQKHRTRTILLIDQIGKWSFMDLFASVVMTVCFYVHISYTFEHYNFDVRIVCEPDLGIVTFVITNLLSMAYSHVFIIWDQKYGYKQHINLRNGTSISHSIGYPEPDQNLCASSNKMHDALDINNGSSVKKLPLLPVAAYQSFYRRDIHLWQADKKYNIFALLYRPQSGFGIVCFSVYLMCLWGILWLIVENSFTVPARFDMEGIAGVALGSPANVRQFSPILIADALIPSTDKYWNALFLAACYWITVIIAPIITQMVLLVIWFCPIKHKHFVMLLKSIWFIQAWNALDVFFIGSISGAMELDTVSKWIIDSTFPELCGDDGILTNMFGMGCFNVMGHITRGCWIAGAAVISQWFAIWFSFSTAKDIGIHGLEY